MNRTIKIISVGLIIIFSGMVILSLTTNIWFGNNMNQQREKKTVTNWQAFQSDQFNFTFRYPSEAIVDISDPAAAGEPKRVRVRFIGPESEPNTEITDRFTFYVRSATMGNGESLFEVAEQIFNSLPDRREVIDNLSEGSEIEGRNTYIFSVRSELGSEVNYTIIEEHKLTAFVTWSIDIKPAP